MERTPGLCAHLPLQPGHRHEGRRAHQDPPPLQGRLSPPRFTLLVCKIMLSTAQLVVYINVSVQYQYYRNNYCIHVINVLYIM